MKFGIGFQVFPDNEGGVSLLLTKVVDLALTKVTAPKTVTLTNRKPEQIKPLKVVIQNQGSVETIDDLATLQTLVEVEVESLGACDPPEVQLTLAADTFPRTLKTKKKLTIPYEVRFTCANDLEKSTKNDPDHEDYRYVVTIDRSVLDGEGDQDPVDDICPRTVAPPFRLDPNPNGKLKDKGCGTKKLTRRRAGRRPISLPPPVCSTRASKRLRASLAQTISRYWVQFKTRQSGQGLCHPSPWPHFQRAGKAHSIPECFPIIQ